MISKGYVNGNMYSIRSDDDDDDFFDMFSKK